MSVNDPVIPLLNNLCSIPSWFDPKKGITEKLVALEVESLLKAYPWLTVFSDEVCAERPNIFALDCAPEEVELLIVGHIDTVCPSEGWTMKPGSIEDGAYYNLGSGDTKGSIAAILNAIEQVGPTKGVGYLFYVDEEYNFLGMDHFLTFHDKVRPKYALSLCGAPAELMIGCRGCIEIGFVIQGHSGHAARQHTGASAIKAMMYVLQGIDRYCTETMNPYKTSMNVGGIFGGSSLGGKLTGNEPPQIQDIPNRIPDTAWAVVDIRPGGPNITSRSVLNQARTLLDEFNMGKRFVCRFVDVVVRLDRGAYASSMDDVGPIAESFSLVHKGKIADPELRGYLDAAEIAARYGTGLVCIAPLKGNEHKPDEWVDIESLLKYRDGCVSLLYRYKA